MTTLTNKLSFGALTILLVAGCSSASSNRNQRIEELNKESQQISAREQQCIEAATKHAGDELSKLTNTQDKDNGQQIIAINQRRSAQLSQCEADADRENEALAAGEQAEYERQAQEERQRAIMMSVIASQPGWH
jgi:hypothetical protein